MASLTTDKVLAATHPRYSAMQTAWQFRADSYEGGDAYTSKDYLFPHPRETQKDFDERKKRASYTNQIRKQVDIYGSFLFKNEPVRTGDDQDFHRFIADADRRGTPLNQLMAEQVAKLAMVYSHVVAVVDLPREAGASRSRAEDIALGIRPYATVYTPLDVTNWSMDALGRFRWIRIREDAPDEADPFQERPKAAYRYRTWTRDAWYVHDETGVLLDAGEHHLGEVPAVLIPAQEHLTYLDVGQSLITDTAEINRTIFNLESLLDDFLYRQAFNFLAVQDPPPPQGVGMSMPPGAQAKTAPPVVVGNGKGVRYPHGSNPPQYVSPPVEPASVIIQRLERAERSLIEVAKLQDRRSSTAEKSGIARAYEFQEQNAAFARIANNLQGGERSILRLFYRWQGKKDSPVAIEYPSDFNVTTLADEIEDALSLQQLRVSPTFDKEVKKRLVDVAMPGLVEEIRSTIDEEIDASMPEDMVAREFGAMSDGQQPATDSTTPPPRGHGY